jgi:hypothetical protein
VSKEKNKKIKIPKAVSQLGWSIQKYAKKHNIKIKGKSLTKSIKKRNTKRLRELYSKSAINGLNKAVKILTEVPPEKKKIIKIRENVEKIIINPEVMKLIGKLYKKDPKSYPNMKFFPRMIINTILYYNSETAKTEGETAELDEKALVKFCEKILKSEIKRYQKNGVPDDIALQLATVVPTAKILHNGRQPFKNLIDSLYEIANKTEVNLDVVLPAVMKVDKKKKIKKNEFYEGFHSEFMLRKSSHKSLSYNDTQKDLHETLIEKTLEYLESLKKRQCKEILKTFIRRRKTAESYKNDTKRVIKFIDHANSNSSYVNIKAVVQELISDNSANELYLS